MRTGKGSFTEMAKIVDKGSQCSTLENTGCKLESEPCLFSVIRLGKNLGDEENCRSLKKPKSLIEVPYVAHLKVQVLSFNMNLIFSP